MKDAEWSRLLKIPDAVLIKQLRKELEILNIEYFKLKLN